MPRSEFMGEPWPICERHNQAVGACVPCHREELAAAEAASGLATCARCGRGIERDMVLLDTVPSNPPLTRKPMHAFCASEHLMAELIDYQHEWALWREKWAATCPYTSLPHVQE